MAALGATTISAWQRAVRRRKGTGAAMRMAAAILAGQSAEAVLSGRQLARRRSMTTLAANLRRHGQPGLAKEIAARIGSRASRVADRARSKRIGLTLGDHWRAAARRAAEDVEGDAKSVAKAVAKRERFRVRMVSATETAQAFNDERERAFEVIAEQIDPEAAEQPWRLWDAKLEACPICARADGSMVRLGRKFRVGSPGKVHPSCRCLEQLVWMPRGFRGKDTSR